MNPSDSSQFASFQDSQQALAVSIARAVQLGLPATEPEEVIQTSVRAALRIEARKNELLLAYLRCALVGTLILASAVAYLRPDWLGTDAAPWWPAGLGLALWLAASIGLTVALAQGWYEPWLKRAVPALDALGITLGFVLMGFSFARRGLSAPAGVYVAAGVACVFLAFSGAVRLSRSGARLATLLALVAWLVIWSIGPMPVMAGVLAAGLILATGSLAARVTRVIRRMIVDEVTRLRLVQLYERAQEAIVAREEVLRVVSHDLRNPLGTIRMAVDMILEDSPTEAERVRYLGMIRRQGETMRHLVDDLLDTARIQSGRLAIEPRSIALGDLIDSAVEMMSPLAGERRISLTAFTPDRSMLIRADPDRISQVFSNLIGNAVKFTSEGGAITVSSMRMGDKVRVTVADTGAGMPPEQLAKIFGRMWQAQPGDSRGIGLGLTIAEAIIEAHGERIGVQSRIGEGTEFWFTLSVAEALGSIAEARGNTRSAAAD
jgi:signal transduction histidine kinase